MTALFIALLASFRAATRSRLQPIDRTEARSFRGGPVQYGELMPERKNFGRSGWMLLSTLWPNWRQAVQIVTPAMVVRWHRRAFAAYWRWNSRPRRVDRPALAADLSCVDPPDVDCDRLGGVIHQYGLAT
jgi:hypothetical protein